MQKGGKVYKGRNKQKSRKNHMKGRKSKRIQEKKDVSKSIKAAQSTKTMKKGKRKAKDVDAKFSQ